MKKLVIVSFGHTDSVIQYAKTISALYDVELIFVYALNKKIESILNFENETLHTGFLEEEKVNRILGSPIIDFIDNKYRTRFYINYNLKVRSFKNIKLAKSLSAYLENFDIVHFNGIDASLMLINGFLKNEKRYFTIHDVKLHSGEKGNSLFNIPEFYINRLIKSKYEVVILNKYDYEEVLKRFPEKKDKINLIPLKFLEIYRHYGSDNLKCEKSDILFFGRMSPYKGLKYLTEAIRIANKIIPGIKVIIAGKGKIEVELEEEDLKKNFLVYNRYIPNDELAGLIRNTKFVVCPYTDSTQSGVAMTAFAFNKPVIASAVGGFNYIVSDGKTGILVPPENPAELANAIIKLVQDDSLVNELYMNIKKECESGSLSWNSILEDAERLYNK